MDFPTKPLINISEALPYFETNDKTFREWIKKDLLPDKMIMRMGKTIKIRTNIMKQYILGEI